MRKRRITLLVEPLRVLLAASHPELHTPALQTIASRGDALRGLPGNSVSQQVMASGRLAASPVASPVGDRGFDGDVLRCALFGHEATASHHPPAAALHLVAARGRGIGTEPYYLRADPVTLNVDRVSVLMSSSGLADLDAAERGEISSIITTALAEAGLQVVSPSGDGWILTLPCELTFDFLPLSAALGADCADLLPEHPDTLRWKRIINEVQMALHACAVNQRRHQSGRREINSVWFWGGGRLPGPSKACRIVSVYSDHPLSRGLAVLQGCALDGLEAMPGVQVAAIQKASSDILVDWDGSRLSAEQDLLELEQVVQGLLDSVRRKDLELRLIDGSGAGWRFNRRCARRFWRRQIALGADSGPGSSI